MKNTRYERIYPEVPGHEIDIDPKLKIFEKNIDDPDYMEVIVVFNNKIVNRFERVWFESPFNGMIFQDKNGAYLSTTRITGLSFMELEALQN